MGDKEQPQTLIFSVYSLKKVVDPKMPANFSPTVIIMTMHHDLKMQPLYTSKMAQQYRECTNLETDCQSSCCYPLDTVARLALFPFLGLPMPLLTLLSPF